MQIHISWKTLLAGLILVLGIVLLLRTAIMYFSAADPTIAAASPTAGTSAGLSSPLATATPGLPSLTATTVPPSVLATATSTDSPTSLPTSTATIISTSTATPEPTAPPASPTPFQPPTREPTAVPASIVVTDQGFGQRVGKVSYAFVVSNPNSGLLAQNVRYQVAAYDAAGIVLLTDTDTIAQVGPGQRMGVGKELVLASNLVVTRIDVLVRPGQYVQAAPVQMLEVTNPAFVEGDPPNLTGIVTNLLSRDLADLSVVGIAYDDSGIIGGGNTILPFVPASGRAPVSIPVVTSQLATRVEFFAPVSSGPPAPAPAP